MATRIQLPTPIACPACGQAVLSLENRHGRLSWYMCDGKTVRVEKGRREIKATAPQLQAIRHFNWARPPLCSQCGGTILQPTRGGVSRGSCHCPRDSGRGIPGRLADAAAERFGDDL